MPTIDEVMERLIGRVVLAVTSDPRSGSLFDLGEWIQRPQRIRNPNLPETQQNQMGSVSMFVRCRWELDSPVDLVPADTTIHGFEQRTRLLESLVGSCIVQWKFSAAPLELTLRFENEMALLLFLARPVYSPETLVVRLHEMHWIIYSNGEMHEEPRVH